MQTIALRTAVMVIAGDQLVTVFPDGRVQVMPLDLPGHADHAPAAGYRQDGRRYIIEHDMVHHLLADWRGHPWSRPLHDNPATPLCDADETTKREEHIVQRTQRAINLAEADPHGVLSAEFGPTLGAWLDHTRLRLDKELGPWPRAV